MSPTSECSFVSNEDFNHEESLKEKREKKTVSREPNKTALKTHSPVKKTSRNNSRSSSPARHYDNQPVRRCSATNDPNAFRRKSNKENEVRKTPRSRSATSGRSPSVDGSLISKPVKSGVALDKFGTWNGKTKKRPGVNSDTYSSNFVRNGVGRSSLGSHSTTYDPATGRRISKTSDQKNMSPLLTDLLKTKNLDDDKTILLKMREIINQYSGIFEEDSENKYENGEENLDFTSEWVRNNGSIGRMESGDFDEKPSPNKRKDSKYDGAHSKIPAPVFFKQQHLSEKEC